ncbi:hypothetical protein J4433_03140 [Candidatus Pacearchaeota archaeon]|nr:hypothetical protein [Candidatus Pacearchaeota archaeon]
MMDVEGKKRKIMEIIQQRGPSLPIHVARGTELNILFASAILSEMVSNKILNVSSLKVGGSPLYYLPGQEEMLDNFFAYLPSKEKDAFLLLKKNNLLEDEKLQPALRVAMRDIKDFAVLFSMKTEAEDKIFWRFHSFRKEDAIKTAEAILSKEKKPRKEERKDKTAEAAKETSGLEKSKEIKKVGTDFIKKVYSFLANENIRVLSEEEAKGKSLMLKAIVNSSIGGIEMLVIAKDKKSVSENDVRVLLSYNQARRLPILFLCNGKPSKKALHEIENFKSFLFLRQIG